MKRSIRAAGLLIHGDNYDALRYLAGLGFQSRVRLVYIDPPFGTRQEFTISPDRFATVSRANNGQVAYGDLLTGDEYLKFLRERLILIRELMSGDGSIYVHIDTKMGHYVKCVLDNVFGQRNFINDITRIKCNPKNFRRRGYGNTKDVVLFYSKGSNFVWNEPRQPIDTASDERFKYTDASGRKYTTIPLHAPGETANGATGKPWRGLSPPPGRHWRCAPELLEQLTQQGRVQWSPTGNPRRIIYAEDVAKRGAKVQDVWRFKDPQNPIYPTEKNLDMLRMVVSASSNEGDWVLDAFAGSGTLLVACQELGRRFIGIDSSKESIKLASTRLLDYELIEMAGGLQDARVEQEGGEPCNAQRITSASFRKSTKRVRPMQTG